MRANLSSELLMGLLGATPEQMSAIELILNCKPMGADAVAENVARQLFALIKELEMEGGWRKAPILQVFRLYCMENFSRNEVAKRCGCAPSLITLRLQAMEKKLGRKPSELRQFSSHFEAMEDSISDSRAKKIYRNGLVDEPENGDSY